MFGTILTNIGMHTEYVDCAKESNLDFNDIASLSLSIITIIISVIASIEQKRSKEQNWSMNFSKITL